MKAFMNELSSKDAVCIKNGQKAFNSVKMHQQITFIGAHFSEFPVLLDSLQSNSSLLSTSLERFNAIRHSLSLVPKQIGFRLLEKLDKVLNKNQGYTTLTRITDYLDNKLMDLRDLSYSPAELDAFKFALVVSCDVEQAFSRFKMILTDRRHNLTIPHLRWSLVIECHMTSVRY